MASSMRRLVVTSNIFLKTVRYRALLKAETLAARPVSRGNSQTAAVSRPRDPAVYFFEENVQELLYDISGDDYEKTFRVRKLGIPSTRPVYKFLTDEELKAEVAALESKRRELLQFPPVLLPRVEETVILSEDPKLQGLQRSKIIFTDITYGRDDKNRLIVVRDPDGTLRYATFEERYRMNCIYFPVEGRSMEKPRLFDKENLKDVMRRKEYEFILDTACIQFEPDDPEYIEIIQKIYDEINVLEDFEPLYSTRHYGSLAFYLAFNRKIDNLLAHCIKRQRINAAASLVKLLYIINPTLSSASRITEDIEPEDVIKLYVTTDSKTRNSLELLLKNYREIKNA